MESQTIYLDAQSVEQAVYNALADSLQDISPLNRAAYVYELQEVERRLESLGAREDTPEVEKMTQGLWRRRGELLGLLWPSVDLDPAADVPADLDFGVRQLP